MEKNSSLAKTDMHGWSIVVTIFLAMTVALVVAGVVLYEKHFGYLLICSIGATMTFFGFLNAVKEYKKSKNKK